MARTTAPRGRGGARRRARFAGLAAGFALLAAEGLARADDVSAFDAGQTAYDAGQYAQAEALLSRMLDPANPPCSGVAAGTPCRLQNDGLIQRARALRAASLVVLNRAAEADPIYEQILLADPAWEPNPAIYPLPAQQRFAAVKKRIQPRLDQIIRQRQAADQERALARQRAKEDYDRWIQKLELMAAQQVVIEHNSRLIACLPFGIGQFQNNDKNLGIVFLVAEALAGGTSIATGVLANYYGSIDPHRATGTNAQGQLQFPDAAALDANKSATLTANRISFAAWATLTAVGIVQAQIAFTSETRKSVPRRVPTPPSVQPTFAVLPGGAAAGLVGTF
ncbi:MAG TPA: hypothetical protein VHB21_20275 [Minicystis sp.]|nr:hypothetical protein [Minicystis sp.]